MTDKELADRFRRLVKEKGIAPDYHNTLVAGLRESWPILWALIIEVQSE